ncbi:MAG: protein kinase [Polyangiaceae bacterium]
MAAPPPRPSAGRPAAGAGANSAQKNDGNVQGTFFLGRYRVVEEIGIGGMASVHLARMDGPGGFQKWVAIKRIHPNLVEDDQFVDMFLDEARIAAGINHANVAQVFDLGKDDNTYWIAMEYLHGEPLREIMRRCEERNQLISPDLAARICADAAEGLHSAHELRGKNNQLLGLVHRDVTPHNLFITYDGHTKVVDFGIAKVADRLSETRAGTLKGKLAYMSPEQVRAQDDVDRTTDVFALGVVLWELTTGHRLFRMDTDLDTLEKVQACVVPPPSTVVHGYPVELESVVMKALAKKKPERFQTAREFSRALQQYLMHRGTYVGPEEVAQFVRELFGDRIKSREEHLAWAADVTSTINIDQLKNSKHVPASRDSAGSGEMSRRGSNASEVDGPPTNQQKNDRRHKPIPASSAPMKPSAPTTQGSGAIISSATRQAGSTSLLEDDEDVPTTVASREHMKDLAGVLAPNAPRVTPAFAGAAAEPPNPQGDRLPSIRSTAMGLGASPNAGGHAAQLPPPPQPPPPNPMTGQKPHALGGTLALSPDKNPVHNPLQYGPGPSSPYPIQNDPSVSGQFPQGSAQSMHGYGQQAAYAPQQQQQAYNAAPSFGSPTFGSPSFGAPPPSTMQPQQPAPQNNMLPGFGPPPNGSGFFGAPPQPQQPNTSQPPHAQASTPVRGPRLAVKETVVGAQRPDAAAWGQKDLNPARQNRKNTAVLVAVALLTAICVAAIAAVIWMKYSAAPQDPASISADSLASTTPKATGPPGGEASSADARGTAPTHTGSAAPTTKESPAADGSGSRPSSSASTTDLPGPSAEPKKDEGYLTIICKPYCDNVRRGGTSLGKSPVVKNPTPPGQYVITLSRAGEPDRTVSATVVAGETAVIRVNMK